MATDFASDLKEDELICLYSQLGILCYHIKSTILIEAHHITQLAYFYGIISPARSQPPD